jgi:hypothetical protein
MVRIISERDGDRSVFEGQHEALSTERAPPLLRALGASAKF